MTLCGFQPDCGGVQFDVGGVQFEDGGTYYITLTMPTMSSAEHMKISK